MLSSSALSGTVGKILPPEPVDADSNEGMKLELLKDQKYLNRDESGDHRIGPGSNELPPRGDCFSGNEVRSTSLDPCCRGRHWREASRAFWKEIPPNERLFKDSRRIRCPSCRIGEHVSRREQDMPGSQVHRGRPVCHAAKQTQNAGKRAASRGGCRAYHMGGPHLTH